MVFPSFHAVYAVHFQMKIEIPSQGLPLEAIVFPEAALVGEYEQLLVIRANDSLHFPVECDRGFAHQGSGPIEQMDGIC